MLGYSLRDLLGKDFDSFRSSENPQQQDQFLKILKESAGHTITERLLDQKGNSHWVEIKGFPIHDNSSARWTAILRDLTEAKLAHNNFAPILEATCVAMALVAEDGYLLLANLQLASLFGYATQELAGKYIDAILPKLWERYQEMGNPLPSQEREEVGYDSRLIGWRKDGSQIPVEIGCRTIVFQDHRWLVISIASIRDSEEKGLQSWFARSFQESPIPMTLTTVTDEHYVDVNARYEQLTGYRREEIVGRSSYEIGLWAYPAQRKDLIRQLLADGYVRDIECSFRMKDGSIRIALSSMTLMRTEQGQLVLSTDIDITEQKRMFQELQQAYTRFRTIFEDAPVGMAVCTLSGRFLEINNAICTFLGYSLAELLRMDIQSIMNAEDVASTLDDFKRMRNGETLFITAERRFIHKSGGTRWGEVRKSVVRDTRSGRPKYVVGQVVDITERKKTEQALRETEARFRTIANSAPVLIWMAGPDKLCTYFNQPWLDFTGRTLQEELNAGWIEGIHRDDVGLCVDEYSRSFDARVPFTLHYRLRRHDGEYRWVIDNGVPRYGPDGTFAGFIGSCIDETDRRAAEAALRGINVKLIEAQEQERKRVARELHDDINQRIAMLAIELQQLEQIPSQQPRTARKLGKLFKQAVGLSSAVQALSHQLHSSSLEHVGIVVAARSFCREFSRHQKVKVDFTSRGVPDAISREVSLALYRTLQEALHNAAKHSGVAKFDVELRGERGQIELQVRDSGVGFDPKNAMKSEGLGLVSIQERILPFRGTLSITSAPQRGTKLAVRIPLNDKV
jgi:PAS domain S-box-containing protein